MATRQMSTCNIMTSLWDERFLTAAIQCVYMYMQHTINHEYFIIKIFSDSLAYAKIQRTKMHV